MAAPGILGKVGIIMERRTFGLNRGRQRWIRTNLRTVTRARKKDK